jgi:hypothetical protein
MALVGIGRVTVLVTCEGLLPAVIDGAASPNNNNMASFTVCRMLVDLVKTAVPIRNPTTRLIAKYAATPLRAQSRYFFEIELPAAAADKFLTVSKFEPDPAIVLGFANASVSDTPRSPVTLTLSGSAKFCF